MVEKALIPTTLMISNSMVVDDMKRVCMIGTTFDTASRWWKLLMARK